MYQNQFDKELQTADQSPPQIIEDSILKEFFDKNGKPNWLKIIWNLGILMARVLILLSGTRIKNQNRKTW